MLSLIFLTNPSILLPDDYALQNHVFATLEVFSEIQCALACTAKQKCSSINVKKKDNESFLCELNDSNKLRSPADYIAKAGYMYFDTNGEQQVRNNRGFLNCTQSHISLTVKFRNRNRFTHNTDTNSNLG